MNTRSLDKFAKWLCVPAMLMFLTMLLVSCNTGGTNSPIYLIRIFKGMPDSPVPPGGWGVSLGSPEPYPKGIQQIFVPGEKIALGLNISLGPDSKNTPGENIAFSKYTFYNTETGEEKEIEVEGDDLGPFQMHSVVLIAWLHPWPVPSAPGTYEFRVYLRNKVVASALFEVKI